METAIAGGISVTVSAMLILLTVGSVIGVWIVSGTVPTMIYYGLKLIRPEAFYVTTCAVCALSAVSVGSSWSVIGTIGLGLFSVAHSLGLPLDITAGAIISGAYFGDKMSPLSDTTNLSPAVAGTDIFTHIRHMAWTTGPAILIALMLYAVLGVGEETDVSLLEIDAKLTLLDETFSVGPHLLLPVLVVLLLAVRRFPALPAMMLSALTAIVMAVIFQRDVLLALMAQDSLSAVVAIVKGIWLALFDGYTASTPDADLNSLLSRGGMKSMLSMIWLVMAAMMFGAVMEKAGFLGRLVQSLMSVASSTASLVCVTALTAIGVNIVMAEQYISIVLPGRMYRMEYQTRGLAPENLSRVLEDAGTVTSPLVPWNTCGAFIAGVLGITAFTYAPYCFFNILSPIFTVAYGIINFKITTVDKPAQTPSAS
jgi:NhaC family Na+:H+ antiporter